MGWGGGYDQLCCPASPKLLLGLDLGLGCDNYELDVVVCIQMNGYESASAYCDQRRL